MPIEAGAEDPAGDGAAHARLPLLHRAAEAELPARDRPAQLGDQPVLDVVALSHGARAGPRAGSSVSSVPLRHASASMAAAGRRIEARSAHSCGATPARKSKSQPSGACSHGAAVERLVAAGGCGRRLEVRPGAARSRPARPAGRCACSRPRGGCGRRRAPRRAGRRRAASGATCSTIEPKAVPDMRASEMRTMSFTPACASFFGIGR